jgi:hypothetical protein
LAAEQLTSNACDLETISALGFTSRVAAAMVLLLLWLLLRSV